mgnify:CR=1 FL=1
MKTRPRNIDSDGFYLAYGSTGGYYIKIRCTDESTIFESRDYRDLPKGCILPVRSQAITHRQPTVKPFPQEVLRDVEEVIIFWIPQREQWIGVLYTFTDEFVDLEEDYPEKRSYLSPLYLAFSDNVGLPAEAQLKEAKDIGVLVRRVIDYDRWLELNHIGKCAK